MPEADREQDRQIQPEADVDDGDHQEQEYPQEFFRGWRITDDEQAKPHDEKAEREYDDGDQEQGRDEFGDNEVIPVDRLR